MCRSDLANKKYKKEHDNFPNIAILTKSATPGEVQLKFTHVFFRNKSFGESVAVFSLAGSLELPSVVSIDVNITFTMDDKKICLSPVPLMATLRGPRSRGTGRRATPPSSHHFLQRRKYLMRRHPRKSSSRSFFTPSQRERRRKKKMMGKRGK